MNNQGNFSNDEVEQFVKDQGGTSDQAEIVKDALKTGNPEALLKSLSPEQSEKLNAILKDQETTKKILNSPAAQLLMKKFGKKN